MNSPTFAGTYPKLYDEVFNKLWHRGIKLGKELGCGAKGCAFEVANKPGFVVKITSDDSEAEASQVIVNKAHPNVCKIYSVWKVNANWFVILMEKLNELNEKEADSVNNFVDELDTEKVRKLYHYSFNEFLKLTDDSRKKLKPDIGVLHDVFEGLVFLDKNGIHYDDMFSGNVLRSNSGVYKLIDLGSSKVEKKPALVVLQEKESIVSPDAFLYDDGKYVWTPERANRAWKDSYRKLEKLLASGKYSEMILTVGCPSSGKSTWLKTNYNSNKIFFDATLTDTKSRRPLIQMGMKYKIPVVAVVFDVPLKVAIARNAARPDKEVPERKVIQMWNRLKNDPPTENEGFNRIEYVRN